MSTGFNDPWMDGNTPTAAFNTNVPLSAADPAHEVPPGVPPPGTFESPEAERQAIWSTLHDVGLRMTSFQHSQDRLTASLDDFTGYLRQMVAEQVQQSAAAAAAAAAPPPPPPPPPSAAPPPPAAATIPVDPRGTPRFKEPAMFGGSASEVDPWIHDMESAVYLQRAMLPTDRDKVLYAVGFLKPGSPKSWYYAVYNDQAHLLDDWRGFLREFKTHFGQSNPVSDALYKLEHLKQTGACATYASKSRELHAFLGLTDFMKIHYFYRGLKDAVKDALVTVKRSDKFDIFVQQCIEIDNRNHEQELEKKGSSKSSNPQRSNERHSSSSHPRHNAPVATTSAAQPASQVVPMEIDAVKRGPLSNAEKERRRKLGLCLYCGEGKHFINDCPNMSAKAKAAFAARSPTSGKA